jgi:hypothetical protein
MMTKRDCALAALSALVQQRKTTSKDNPLVNAVRAFFIFFSSFGPNVSCSVGRTTRVRGLSNNNDFFQHPQSNENLCDSKKIEHNPTGLYGIFLSVRPEGTRFI